MAQQAGPSLTQGNFISTDTGTTGFDLSSGSKWIYPENYPRREYQFSIVQTALFNNTLVCLPTGLGKTFIAAVVMYNFWRWYPTGRVVFLAPTKPLVAQQIHACHEIMGIPSAETVELTGAINQIKRREAWTKKRVIFATPQTFQKDLQNDCVPCDLIKCIVIDEAHKALGKHSYCEIVRMVNEKSRFFRVLALSATPGSKIDHVREVIQNLLISELELRDDTSPDITPYTNDRSMEQIIVGLGKTLNEYKERYVNIMDPHVRILIKNHILQGSAANISKGRIFMLMKQYESKPQKAQSHGVIMKTLNILLTMYHAYELLVKHGLRAFYNFYASHSDKYWLEAEIELQLLLEDIKRYIGIFPVIESSHDGDLPDIPDGLIFGHAKFDKLRELLVDHFKSFCEQNKTTRAIVFVEYRDIVNEVFVLLLQSRPLIRPQMFVGQAGQKQKQQLAALEDFRNNKVNVLISTSVGEEGLDVGEVDLIVCFDISSSTPIRLVQRMGRTGRKRNGRVVLLLTEGKEVQTLNQAISKKDSLNNKVLQSSNITSSLYQSSPRMVPADINPECLPIFIKAQPKTPTVKGRKPKAPVERKSRKKKKDTVFPDDPQPSSSGISAALPASQGKSKSDSNSKASSSQSSMMRFLTGQHQQKKPLPSCSYDSDNDIICEEFQSIDNNQDNPYAIIRPHEVKLLTSDSHALEFLTLCAMKKSNQSSSEPDIIKVDKTWIPPRSPPKNIIQDFVIPSLDTLDCIKNLTIYDGPIEKEIQDDFEQDFISNDRRVSIDVENIELNYFEEPVVQSKYADDTKKVQEEIEMLDSSFFEDFSADVESKYVGKSDEVKQIAEEIVTSDFFDNDFSAFDCKADSFAKKDSTKLDNNEKTKEPEEIIVRTPAHVEVDFENILDEYTESEASEADRKPLDEANIFDDLLDESSIDEDLFGVSRNDQNITVVPNEDKNNLTLVESPRLSMKRSASRSPCGESIKKRLKTSQKSSNSEILGTPTKLSKQTSNVSCTNEAPKAETAANTDSDSDKDLFDDIEFETQFTFAISKNKVKSEQENNKDENENAFEESFNRITNNSLLEREKIRDESKKRESDVNDFTFGELSILNGNKTSQDVEAEHVEDERLSGKDNNVSQPKNETPVSEPKNEKFEDISDINLDDWNDNFDFGPLVIPKNKIEEEDVSRFFSDGSSKATTSQKPENDLSKAATSQKTQKDIHPFFSNTSKTTTSQKLQSQKPSTSTSGWITIEKSKDVTRFPSKRPLAFKNVNILSLHKPSKPAEKEDSPKKSDFLGKNNDHEILFTHQARHPSLSLLSLKKKYTEPATKDSDGFVLPQIKPKVSPKPKPPNDLNTWKVPFANKENKLPRHRKDNSISPRFRKYHSENNLSTRKKKNPKARKRIAAGFIEEEAEQSDDVDTSEGSSCDEDGDLDNFVSYTQDVTDDVDMRAHYLQTVNKSPIRAGNFIFKAVQRQVPDHDIYSQPMTQTEESYLHDSFCVGDTTQHIIHDDSDGISEDSLLEDIETCLENRRSKRQRKQESKFENFRLKRKRSRTERNLSSNESDNNNSSSEDETEALRRQILEESMMMKK